MEKARPIYVPGAEAIKLNLAELTRYALQNGYSIMGSVDRHSESDAELKVFVKHCMDKTEGQKKIPETSVANSAFIENRAYSANELKRLMSATAVYFEKQEINVFSNANANLLIRFDAAVVYGVATEYCVKEDVLGMIRRGLDVFVVEDAIAGITPDGEAKAIEEMKSAGARFIKTKDVLEGRVEEMLREMWR